jgi:hypothetical protein
MRGELGGGIWKSYSRGRRGGGRVRGLPLVLQVGKRPPIFAALERATGVGSVIALIGRRPRASVAALLLSSIRTT